MEQSNGQVCGSREGRATTASSNGKSWMNDPSLPPPTTTTEAVDDSSFIPQSPPTTEFRSLPECRVDDSDSVVDETMPAPTVLRYVQSQPSVLSTTHEVSVDEMESPQADKEQSDLIDNLREYAQSGTTQKQIESSQEASTESSGPPSAAECEAELIIGKEGGRQNSKGPRKDKKPSVFRRLFANGKREINGRKGNASKKNRTHRGKKPAAELEQRSFNEHSAAGQTKPPVQIAPNATASGTQIIAPMDTLRPEKVPKGSKRAIDETNSKLDSTESTFSTPIKPSKQPTHKAPGGLPSELATHNQQKHPLSSSVESNESLNQGTAPPTVEASGLTLTPSLQRQTSVSSLSSSAFSVTSGSVSQTTGKTAVLPGQTPPNSPCQTSRVIAARAKTPETTKPLAPPPLQRRSSWFSRMRKDGEQRRPRSRTDAPNKPVRSVSPPPPGKRAIDNTDNKTQSTTDVPSQDKDTSELMHVPVQQESKGSNESESEPSESNISDRWSPAVDMFYDGGPDNILEPPKLPIRRRQPDEDDTANVPPARRLDPKDWPTDNPCPGPPPILSPSNPSATGIVVPRATRPSAHGSYMSPEDQQDYRSSCTLDHHPSNFTSVVTGIRPTLSSSDEDDEEVSLLSEQASITRKAMLLPKKSILKKKNGFRVVSPASTASSTPSPISMSGHILDTTPIRMNRIVDPQKQAVEVETSLDSGILSATPRASPKTARYARFKYVEIREYERALGDNPSATGVPISIGWEYHCMPRVTVDEFERWKGKSVKTRKEMYLTDKKRRQLLRGISVPPSPMEVQRVQQEAEYIQYCRERVRHAEKKRQFKQRVQQQRQQQVSMRAFSPIGFGPSPSSATPPPLYSDSDSCSSMDESNHSRNQRSERNRQVLQDMSSGEGRWKNGEEEWEESILNRSMMIHEDDDQQQDVVLGNDCRQPDDSDTSQPVSRRMVIPPEPSVGLSRNHRATPIPPQWMEEQQDKGFASDVEETTASSALE